MWTRHKAVIVVAAVIVLAGLVTGVLFALLGGQAKNASATPSDTAELRSPFTGEPVRVLNPVLAVKIDNIVHARPQTGLTHADIVYVLPVEGGLSRFLAIFSSGYPPVVGPVRSAREDDLQVLRQFGRPAFAYSGATPALLADAHGASKASDIGFRFGPLPAGGRSVPSYSASYPAASFTFRWSAKDARWLVWMDGAAAHATEGGQLSAPTVVIQYTKVRTSRFLEAGTRPPYAESTRTGTGVVLRGGQAYAIRWSRPDANGATTFTTASGQPMTSAPGPVWVVLTAAP